MNLLDVLEAFAREVPAFLTCSIVSVNDGTSIGTIGDDLDGVDPAAIEAYFTEVLKKNSAALNVLGLNDATEDMLVTTESAHFLVRTLPQTPYFWSVITGQRGSLGLTRALMRKYEGRIIQMLP